MPIGIAREGEDAGVEAFSIKICRSSEIAKGDVCEITAWGAKVRTLVIATDEELMIARDTKEVIEK